MKSNMISSLLALVFGVVIGTFYLGRSPNIAESSRVEHFIMMTMLVVVSAVLVAKTRENKRLKKQLESMKS